MHTANTQPPAAPAPAPAGQRNSRLYFLLARTPLHPGSGGSLGAIDQPVNRHVVTGHPQVPRSSLKGCLREPARRCWGPGGTDLQDDDFYALFGKEGANGTGMLSIQDANLLLLPVACWAGGWAWATSPSVLRRLQRDARSASIATASGQAALPQQVPVPAPCGAMVVKDSPLITSHGGRRLVVLLEELLDEAADTPAAAVMQPWANWLADRVMGEEDESWREQFKQRLAVVPDDAFDLLTRTAMDVRARIRIGKDGVAADKALWREEYVPEDAVFYGTLSVQAVASHCLDEAKALAIPQALELQLGGNGSVGAGWVNFRPLAAAPTPGGEA